MTDTDKKKLVLIVDDAPTNIQMVRSILKDDFMRSRSAFRCLCMMEPAIALRNVRFELTTFGL